jgi:hypothetical protein
MQHIETVTLDSAQSSITFSAIPADYTDLLLKFSLRDNQSGEARAFGMKVNTATPTARLLGGNGSSAFSHTESAYYLLTNGNTATANTFSSGEAYFPNYKSTANKSVSIDNVTETNGTFGFQTITAALYSVTVPITSIELYSTASPYGNLVEHSSASLYGILAGSDGIVSVS